MKPDVSIILPTFNESQNILPLITAIEKEVQDYAYEILVVDDQSSDGTAQKVNEIKNPKVRVIVRRENLGFARAIARGIEEAKGLILVIMDSDFNHNPSDLSKMLKAIVDYDVISASRFIKGGSMSPPWRSMASWLFNKFIQIRTGSLLTDHLFGFFVFKRSVLPLNFKEDIFYGFGEYSIRLLHHWQRSDTRMLEMPSVYGPRRAGCGNKKLVGTFFRYVAATLSLKNSDNIK